MVAVISGDYWVTVYDDNQAIGYLTDYFDFVSDAMDYAKSITDNVVFEV